MKNAQPKSRASQSSNRSGQKRGHLRVFFGLFWCLFFHFITPNAGLAGEWDPLIEKLVADGFSKTKVEKMFDRAEVRFDASIMAKKMQTLYKKKFGSESVRKLQKRLALLGYNPGKPDGKAGVRTRRAIRWFQKAHGLPVDGKPSTELLQMAIKERKRAPDHVKIPPPSRAPLVYKTIMTPERLDEARTFYTANRKLLNRLERHFGVPREITVGILTVETRLGRYLGDKSAFQTLASMALCDDFSCIKHGFKDEHITNGRRRWLEKRARQKARWAYEEWKALLTYAQNNQMDPLSIPGSFYGAIGIAQFMPSKALRYGVDGNGDGVVDLFVLEDALFSMGRYLLANGWRGSMRNRRKQRRAIYNYNQSVIYVNTVLAVADYLEEMNRGDPKLSHSIRNDLGNLRRSAGFPFSLPRMPVLLSQGKLSEVDDEQTIYGSFGREQ